MCHGVRHGVLPTCWSVKIDIGGCVSRCASWCAPYMLVCEDCHRQRVCRLALAEGVSRGVPCMLVLASAEGVLSACWSVKIGIGRGCVTGCSLHVGLGIGRGCVMVCSLHVGM